MKKYFVLLGVVWAAGWTFAFDWAGKSGTVEISESVSVTDADRAVISQLTGIVLKGEASELVFLNTTALTVPGTITGDGQIIKRGTGDVTFGSPHTTTRKQMCSLGNCYFDHYTKKGIVVETGDLYLPQAGGAAAWYGPVTIAAGATLHIHPDSGTGVDALNGAGTIDNGREWTWYHNPDAKKPLNITNYGNTHHSNFSGTFVGNISIVSSGIARFTGTNSLASASFGAFKNSNTSARDRGISSLARFGNRAPLSKRGTAGTNAYFQAFGSTLGVGDSYYYGADFDINYGGTLVYCGEGETTNKKFRFGSSDYYGWPVAFDAGETGGVTFTGSISQYGTTKTNGSFLRGSNTEEMVVSCNVSSSGGILAFKKQGPGTWRFAGKSRPGYAGAWHVEEGTLRYDSIADIGDDSALGLSTNCYPFSHGKALPAYWQNTEKLPYEIELGAEGQNPVFEYSGSEHSCSHDRRIGLVGSEATISSGSAGGSVELLGGVSPADGADKTLHLTGSNEAVSTLDNVSDGAEGGVLSVDKAGTGAWALTGDLSFSGALNVREGTLVLSRPAPRYRWYRLTITKIGAAHEDDTTGECSPSSYYIRLRGLALYTLDGTLYVPEMEDLIPWDQMTAAQANGSKSFRYPTSWWKNLQPGEITIGDYTGAEYRTYPGNTPKYLFSNLNPTNTGMVVYNTYLACTPGPNNSNAWLPIVFRLPEDAPAIEYYDILADYSSETYSHVATWKLEGSADGIAWTPLHEITSCAHTKQNYWASTGSATAYSPNANCLSESRGYKIFPDPGVTNLPPRRILTGNPSVRVASGATLKAEGKVEIARLTVDCAAPSGTLDGIAFASDGVLDFVNYTPAYHQAAISFVNCSGLDNLTSWQLNLNGEESTDRRVRITPTGLSAGRKGFILAVDEVSTASKAHLTLEEDFEDLGQRIGASSRSWSAAQLVGDNCGSIFFDVTFGDAQEPKSGQRSIINFRTKSRLGIAWLVYGNKTMTFSFSDRTEAIFDTQILSAIEVGRTYHLGCTWDGESVRAYVDGKVVASSTQLLPVKTSIVGKIYAGPFNDNWIAPSAWADDVILHRLRVWDGARTPAEIAAEEGLVITALAETNPPRLSVPTLPAGVDAPTIDGTRNETAWNDAGSLPPESFRFVADVDYLYFSQTTNLPGHGGYVPAEETWTLVLDLNGHEFRFGADAADLTAASRDGDEEWSVDWSYAATLAMQITDELLWTGEAAIPWAALGGRPADGAHGRFKFVRTGASADEADWVDLVWGAAAAYQFVSGGDPGRGEYTESYRLIADRASKLTYTVSIASRDGTFAPIELYTHTYSAAKGDILTDSLSVATRVPGYDALLETLLQGTNIVMRAIVPFTLSADILDVTPLLLQERIAITFKKLFTGTLRLIGPSGETVRETACDGTAVTWDFPRASAAGEYTVQLFDATGELISEKPISYPGIGEWENQDFREEMILPTFEPMTTTVTPTGFVSSLVLRRYTYANSLLPTSLISIGEELLAAPTEILVDGVPLACAAFEVVSNRPHHVGFVADGTNAVATATLDGWLEYDGVSYNNVTVTRTGSGKGTLAVRYHLKPAFAKYLHAASGSGWGAKKTMYVPDGESFIGSYSTMWTGNEEKGFVFFYETRGNWKFASGKLYAFAKDADELTVTVTVNNALAANSPFAFEFGLMASPARALAPGYPFDTLTDTHCTSFNRPGRRPLYDVSILSSDEVTTYPGGDLGSFFGDLDTTEGHKQDRLMRHILDDLEAGTGSRPIPYTCSRYLSEKYPEVTAYLADWTFKPEVAMDNSNSGHVVYDCCPRTKASDFFVWKYKSMLARYPGIKGIYCDFGTIHSCANANHGCDERTPILGWREFNRRLCVAQVEAGIDYPVVVLHNTDCVQLPAMTFATHLLNGEHIRQASSDILHDKKDILDTYGYEMFASELSSLPWGLSNSAYMPFDNLSAANGGGDETNAAYKFRMGKASIGACLLHNTMQSLWRNHIGLFDKVLRYMDDFGADTARFIGYWRKPATVTGADDVEVSCYTDGTNVLAVVAQMGKEHHDQDVTITFDLAQLGLQKPLVSAVDKLPADDPEYQWYVDKAKSQGARTYSSRIPTDLGEFGTSVGSFDGQVLHYHLPYHTFGLIELKPAQEE